MTAIEVTARVQKGFSFIFLDLSGSFLLFLVFYWLGASMFGLLGASVEVVRVRASSRYGAHNRSDRGLFDSETGPDLTWQWTLAVAVCGRLQGT